MPEPPLSQQYSQLISQPKTPVQARFRDDFGDCDGCRLRKTSEVVDVDKMENLMILHIIVSTSLISQGHELFDKDNSGSGCAENLQLLYDAIEIDNVKEYLKLEFKCLDSLNKGIAFNIINFEEATLFSGISPNRNLVFVSLVYLSSSQSYISLYPRNGDIACQQKPVNYSINSLKKSNSIAKSEVIIGQTVCLDFPQETAEVVWPLDSNVQDYCECTKKNLKSKSCDCFESKLFEVTMYNDQVCFNVTSVDADRTAIFFQETEVDGCGANCMITNLLSGHQIGVSSIATFSFQYNQFYFDATAAFISWFEPQCGPQTKYILIESEPNNSTQHLGSTTSTFVTKIPANRFYIQAHYQNNALCTTSAKSLQVPRNVTTFNEVIYDNDDAFCVNISGVTTQSTIILPEKQSNNSCICTNIMKIDQCTCIGEVGFGVYYNSSSDKPLCFSNVTRNDTRIHFMSQHVNTMEYRNKGFPSYNLEFVDSFTIVMTSPPSPPLVIENILQNNSVCFVDTFDGYSKVIRYYVFITDATGYTTAIVHEKKESMCLELHGVITNQTLRNCGSLQIRAKSENEIGNSSVTEIVIQNDNKEQICDCFRQNVNISLEINRDSKSFELNCDTQYINFCNNSKLKYKIEQNDNIEDREPVNCSSTTTIQGYNSDFSVTIYWTPDGDSLCPVKRRYIEPSQQHIAAIVGGSLGFIALVVYFIFPIVAVIIYRYRRFNHSLDVPAPPT